MTLSTSLKQQHSRMRRTLLLAGLCILVGLKDANAAFVHMSSKRTMTSGRLLFSTKEPIPNDIFSKSDDSEDTNGGFNSKLVEELSLVDPERLEREAIETFSETDEPTEQVSERRSDASFYDLDSEAMENEALRLLSSELGVKMLNGQDYTSPVPLGLILERTLDTVEDVLLHLKRVPYDLGWQSDALHDRKTVVVLGSGWASHALLKVADNFKLRVIVVSPSNHFVFTPMLASAAVGTVEYRSMTEAVRAANPMIEEYVEGIATNVDIERKVVSVKLNSLLETIAEGEPPCIDIPYDHLVVGVGARVSDGKVPGASQHCLKLKSCDDARHLRESIGECFEYASRPDVAGTDPDKVKERKRRVTFLIVGGGPTGVELAGELSDLARDITKPRVGAYPRLGDSVQVILVHGGSQLLQQFEDDLRDEALKALEKQGVDVRLNTKVSKVGDGFVDLSSKEFDENGNVIGTKQEILPVGVSVWCAGTAPVPFVNTLLDKLPESARGNGGRINVDKWMRVDTGTPETFGSILVLGDAASFQERKDTESFLPQTAQVAGQQGAYASRLLCRGYDLTVTPPRLPAISGMQEASTNSTGLQAGDAIFESWLRLRGLDAAPGFGFLNLGLLAYLGGGQALSQVQIGDVNLFSYAGSVAFVLWRSVYLVKQVATRNRVLVTFDWIKSSLFGRDVTRL